MYLPDSNTQNVNKFEYLKTYGEGFSYDPTVVIPEKGGDGAHGAGITYAFANKWVNVANAEQVITVNENGEFQDFTVPTSNMTFVAVYDATVHSFNVTYYFSDNESDEYVQYGDVQTVEYGATINYRTVSGTITWFTADCWYGNEARSTGVLSKMPDEDIAVYGTYKFNVGIGDVNGDGSVNSNDITLYRQWVVGGYEMTVIASGNEWATVTAQDFDATKVYFLKRVADGNQDNSYDIRDVSITRMAVVGGYSWDVEAGAIKRSTPAYNISAVVNGLNAFGRARLFGDVTAASTDVLINSTKSLYLDLAGYTLTVKSLTLTTSTYNATIKIVNGTIIAEDGITVAAPVGNVVIEDVTAYVDDNPINLQAADSSLHFAGAVEFYDAEIEAGELQMTQATQEQAAQIIREPAPIHVEEGTHVVVEQAAEIVIEKIVVTENSFEVPVTPSVTAAITLDNKTETIVEVEGNIANTITTLAELVVAATDGGSVVLGEDIVYNGTIVVTKDLTINLNKHMIKSNTYVALQVKGAGVSLTISGDADGSVVAQEMCAQAFDGAILTINGGTYTAIDNAVFGTNGTAGRGGNTITVNAGTFNGGITSAGYVACGIYVANNDTVVVNGGTFNVTNGCGILARSGNTTIGEDVVFNVTGDGHTGKVGDSKVTVPSGAVLVYDLAADYPGGEPTITNNTEYDVTAVVGSVADIDAVRGWVKAIVLGKDIVNPADDYIIFRRDMILNLNGHSITDNDGVAIYVASGASLTINGNGSVTAQEMCVLVTYNSTLIINGGTYTARDNAVFGTNGTVKENDDRGHNTITINDGTFNGNIESAGYVACGIYVANSDTVTVNGGIFNITNGVGILSRSGVTTVNGGTFNVTGDGHLGKVGDSKVTVPAGEVLVLDLKAAYPGGMPILNNNTSEEVYVVVDGTYTFAGDDATFHAARGVYDNVILTGDFDDYLYVTKDMNIYLNGHTVDASSTSYCAIYVTGGATVTINGNGNVIATEGCVLVTYASELIVNGGTYTCYDNFVFGTNGTVKPEDDRGHNTITVNAGTFNGQIFSSGYVACGIYVANSDTVTVTGGTFNVEGGVGILARSGNTTVNGGTFNVTGDGTLGKVGDSRVVVPSGEVLILDNAANYPGGAPTLTNNTSYTVYTVEAE